MSVRSFIVVFAAVGVAACSAPPPPPPAAPFSVVEASVAEMQQAMSDGRVTSRQLVEQYLQRIALYEERAQRDIGRERQGARGRGSARRGTPGRQGARAAARHPGRAQGQHPHHRHADDRRRGGVRGLRAALRRDADHALARGRRRDPRQDGADRAGQLHRPGHARQLQRPRRLRAEPYDPRRDPRAATADGRPVAGTGGSSSGIGTARTSGPPTSAPRPRARC